MLTSRWETCSRPLSSCKLVKWMVRKLLTQIINPPRNGAPIVLPLFFAELHFKLVTSQLFLFIWNAAVIIEKSLLKSLLRTSEKKVIHRNKSLCSKQKNQTQSSSTSHFLFHRWPGSTIQTPTLMTRGPKRSLPNWPKPTRYETRQEHNLLFFFFPKLQFFAGYFRLFFYFSHSSTFRCWGTRWRGNSTTPTERQVLTPIEPTLRSSSSTEPRGQI